MFCQGGDLRRAPMTMKVVVPTAAGMLQQVRRYTHLSIYLPIYIYICIYASIYLYLSIYLSRVRVHPLTLNLMYRPVAGPKEVHSSCGYIMHLCVCICMCVYIYIYIYSKSQPLTRPAQGSGARYMRSTRGECNRKTG